MLSDLITVASFLVCTGLAWVIARGLLRLQRDPIQQRLAAARLDGPLFPRGDGLAKSLAEQLPQTTADNNRLEAELRRAGLYKPTARQEFLALRNALVILAVISLAMILVRVGPERPEIAWDILGYGLIVVCLCWAIPRLVLMAKGRARVARIRCALPDALDMITMCLTGGLPLQDALSHVSRELCFAHPDLAVELLIVRQQADMTTFPLAFQQWSRRIDAPEIVSLATLVAQGQRLGTDIVRSIRDYADGMRLSRRQRSDEQSSKAAVKMLLPLTLCLLPSVFILLWGPAALDLWEFFQNIGDLNASVR